MPRLSLELRRLVVTLRQNGSSVEDISRRLSDGGVTVSRTSLYKLLKKYKEKGTLGDLRRATKVPKLNEEHLLFIDNAMAENDEANSTKLLELLTEKWPTLQVSKPTIKRARKKLGWVATRPKYCQLVRDANKEKRLIWCVEQLHNNEQFDDVIFTDECSVQLDNHSRICFRRIKQLRKYKPRPKHPIKVHIWGGISKSGATSIVIFTGIMTSTRFCMILENGLKPFIEKAFPNNNYRFQMDNDPKHTSNYTKDYLRDNNINWWATPPESPDLNPIENVWGSMKRFLRDTYKPTNLESLKAGIIEYWKTLTPAVCAKYISHLRKVIPRVIEVNGAASGY